jgi:hypothetical protein
MLPPVETNYDLVVQNSVTPSANTTYNLGQKDLRYLNVWSDQVACSNIGFHSGGNFVGTFDGSYASLRDTPELSETLTFFPDKSLTLTAQSNNLISGLTLETSGPRLSYFLADRIVCNETSLANGLIENLANPELFHQAANKVYVDNRFLSYTPTWLMDTTFE